ncbi:geranylgeranyl reductase family protein [Corynebacterium lowii]|uniref:Putative oxidoreductase n=1 Tax=Corynebacterium lowii TaxID=1544413 RepID=A0A0Q0UG91_9CORY|nr:geranylgeranyl reductase family protein [Corynebacterium lowii]KQB87351.1 putative oxidoreductase [Corynebacterium lowii]MDP9852060.1 geranylgeranyl reductase family protein [Corynebacterium lowii]
MSSHLSPFLLIIGAGPAGSAAAIWAASRGFEVLLIDAASFPRDKTCGDGLTPRAIHHLDRLGLSRQILHRYSNRGLKLHGFGGSVTAPWPHSEFGSVGSAMPRVKFDALLLNTAREAGASVWEDAHALRPEFRGDAISGVLVRHRGEEKMIRPASVLVADGVRSPFGKQLGRTWHQEEVYGIAARSYCTTPHHREPWIHSHLELRDAEGIAQPGYGWIFPLANGTVNLGCGALSTTKRRAKVNTKKLLEHYAGQQRQEWELGEPQAITSALLPMGGAVSNVAGRNWMLIGDAAACVNPLNGEGIDYGMETAALAVSLLGFSDYRRLWPTVLREEYGDSFALARTAARLLTYPRLLPAVGPLALRGPLGARLMPAAARLMGNLVTEEDRDLVARAWRAAGGVVSRWPGHRALWD